MGDKIRGQYIAFSTKLVTHKRQSSNEEGTNNKAETVSGKTIVFNIAEEKKRANNIGTLLTGKLADFVIKEQGQWSWDEKPIEICMICKLPLKSRKEIVRCPMCQSLFHEEHLLDWLRLKGKCPVCFQNLKAEAVEKVEKSN